MQEIPPNHFCCEMCGGVFEKEDGGDERARAEFEENKKKYFGEVPETDTSIICDDCYQKIRPDEHPKEVELYRKLVSEPPPNLPCIPVPIFGKSALESTLDFLISWSKVMEDLAAACMIPKERLGVDWHPVTETEEDSVAFQHMDFLTVQDILDVQGVAWCIEVATGVLRIGLEKGKEKETKEKLENIRPIGLQFQYITDNLIDITPNGLTKR